MQAPKLTFIASIGAVPRKITSDGANHSAMPAMNEIAVTASSASMPAPNAASAAAMLRSAPPAATPNIAPSPSKPATPAIATPNTSSSAPMISSDFTLSP